MPKFKQKKKKVDNNRRIAEPLPQDKKVASKTEKSKKTRGTVFEDLVDYLTLFFVILGVCLVFFVGYVYLGFEKTQEARRRVEDNYTYWKDVVRVHPNLTDAYYNAAIYSVQLGDNRTAITYLDKALELDPDFTKAKELKVRITK